MGRFPELQAIQVSGPCESGILSQGHFFIIETACLSRPGGAARPFSFSLCRGRVCDSYGRNALTFSVRMLILRNGRAASVAIARRPWARPPRITRKCFTSLRPVGSHSYRARSVRGSASEPPQPRGFPPKPWQEYPGGSASWVYPPFGERAHAAWHSKKAPSIQGRAASSGLFLSFSLCDCQRSCRNMPTAPADCFPARFRPPVFFCLFPARPAPDRIRELKVVARQKARKPERGGHGLLGNEPV